MLKGILFIIAIIVTFDIGKALIDSYREEQALEKAQEQLNTEEKDSTSESDGGGERTENNDKAPLNLNLPEDSFDQEQNDQDAVELESDAQSTFLEESQNNKSLNLNTKPIMTFDVETRTPDVTGVTVEVKKNY